LSGNDDLTEEMEVFTKNAQNLENLIESVVEMRETLKDIEGMSEK